MSAELSFTLQAGWLMARQVIRQIKEYCFVYHLRCNIDSYAGLGSNTYFITITGPSNEIVMAKKVIEEWKSRL